jgi:ferredoxin-type protein NapH
MRLPFLRRISVTLVIVLVVVGLVVHTGTGTISSFGWREIAAICPLGIVEVFLAEKTLIPRALIVLLLTVIVVSVLGKVFCGWLCPVPPLRRLFAFSDRKRIAQKTESVSSTLSSLQNKASSENPEQKSNGLKGDTPSMAHHATQGCAQSTPHHAAQGCAQNSSSACSSCAEKRARLDSRHVVLGGALLSTAIFGFPVFCLICPVGLCFATVIAFWRWVGFDELTLSLLVFPAILAIEVLVLRTWCLRFCPLGAVFSLMSLPNRFLRPHVNEKACLRNRGIDCNICVEICEEELDPHFDGGMHECTKCGECVSRCPARAITIPFRNPKKELSR